VFLRLAERRAGVVLSALQLADKVRAALSSRSSGSSGSGRRSWSAAGVDALLRWWASSAPQQQGGDAPIDTGAQATGEPPSSSVAVAALAAGLGRRLRASAAPPEGGKAAAPAEQPTAASRDSAQLLTAKLLGVSRCAHRWKSVSRL
jgi:hypothetical protein